MTVDEALAFEDTRMFRDASDQSAALTMLATEVRRLRPFERPVPGKDAAITHAAIKQDGRVFSLPWPCRHGHVLACMSQAGIEQVDTEERHTQGFLTADGRFVDRVEGAALAIESGQINKLKWPPYLYSEDLW